MCTLTIFQLGEDRFRLAFNRDEARSRAPAALPRRRCFADRTALLPIDPVGRGTWIAVNDAGLALALLNVNPPDDEPVFGTEYSVPSTQYSAAVLDRPRVRSRGTIIPALLRASGLREALQCTASLPIRDHAPFRLVLFGRGEMAELAWDGRRARRQHPMPLVGPVMFTSSGLGDELVEAPRRELFDAILRQPGDAVARQDTFHRHVWSDRPHLSVCMRREDAYTVSHTVISLDSSDAVLTYYPGSPDRPAPAFTARLRFTHGGPR
jgi:hypothetical protein